MVGMETKRSRAPSTRWHRARTRNRPTISACSTASTRCGTATSRHRLGDRFAPRGTRRWACRFATDFKGPADLCAFPNDKGLLVVTPDLVKGEMRFIQLGK